MQCFQFVEYLDFKNFEINLALINFFPNMGGREELEEREHSSQNSRSKEIKRKENDVHTDNVVEIGSKMHRQL